jgi:hypothetical protein
MKFFYKLSNLIFKKRIRHVNNLADSLKDLEIYTFFDSPSSASSFLFNEKKSVCYFLKRPWGNIMIYNHQGDIDYKFIKSRGGLFRYYDWKNLYRSKNEQIFSRLGTSFISLENQEDLYPSYSFSEAIFLDPTIELYQDQFYWHMIVIQKSKKLLFLDPRMFENGLTLSHKSDFKEKLSPSLLHLIKHKSIDYLFLPFATLQNTIYLQLSDKIFPLDLL